MKKLLFIDTNVFLHCVLQRTEDLDCEPLKDIAKKLDDDKLLLIMPEITGNEIFNTLKEEVSKLKEIIEENFKNLSQNISKGKDRVSRLITDSIKDSRENCLKRIDDANEKGLEIIKKIVAHKNTKKVKMTNDLILSGMKRSLLKRPPFSIEKNKGSHTKDQDCIAFESLLFFLKKGKYKKYILITCIDDRDYKRKKDSNELKREIEEELSKLCKTVKSYQNPLKMLKEEFSTHYSEKDIKQYTFSTMVSPTITNISDYFNLSPASTVHDSLGNSILVSANSPATTLIGTGTSLKANNAALINEFIDKKDICPYCGLSKEFSALGHCIYCNQNLL